MLCWPEATAAIDDNVHDVTGKWQVPKSRKWQCRVCIIDPGPRTLQHDCTAHIRQHPLLMDGTVYYKGVVVYQFCPYTYTVDNIKEIENSGHCCILLDERHDHDISATTAVLPHANPWVTSAHHHID